MQISSAYFFIFLRFGQYIFAKTFSLILFIPSSIVGKSNKLYWIFCNDILELGINFLYFIFSDGLS